MSKSDVLISLALEDIASGLDEYLEKLTGEHHGFCLMVYSRTREGYSSYISNVDRKVTVRAMKDLIEIWESNLPDTPCHQRH